MSPQMCDNCGLHKTRTKIVNGRGNPQASIWLIGRDPGAQEDKIGVPFIGRAGKRMVTLISDLGYDIEKDFYIVNMVRCHTPHNRGPSRGERDTCKAHLIEEIHKYKPKLMIALGKEVAFALLEKDAPMAAIRGEIIRYNMELTIIKTFTFEIYPASIMPTYHPSYLIRCGHKHDEIFKTDIKKAMQYVRKI